MSKFAVLFCSFGVVRTSVRFMERNHLTSRTREDIFYHTNPTFKCLEQDSVLSCFTQSRVPVRPKNFLRRLLFDWRRRYVLDVVRLESNMAVRNAFRNISQEDVFEALEHMEVAPANNHGLNAATRNAASHLLSHVDWGNREFPFNKFSLSGSRLEMLACGHGYRGRHQATDLAFEERRNAVLTPAVEITGVPGDSWVVISTDTTNHLPSHDKNAILGNGVPIVSYSPTAITESIENPNRVTYWDGNVMVTNVNGGGTYRDHIGNGALDVEYVDCPDGDLMCVYVDAFMDPRDRTHAYIAEVPFAKIARGTHMFNLFRDEPRVQDISPYTITNKKCQSFSCLSVRHNNLIQIVDNDARQTFYFTRTELLALDDTEPGMKSKFRLQEEKVAPFGETQSPLLRFECLKRVGFNNLHMLCKLCPEINVRTPTRQGRKAWVADAVIDCIRKGDDFRELFRRFPDDEDLIRRILEGYRLDYVVPPPPQVERNGNDETHPPPPGFEDEGCRHLVVE